MGAMALHSWVSKAYLKQTCLPAINTNGTWYILIDYKNNVYAHNIIGIITFTHPTLLILYYTSPKQYYNSCVIQRAHTFSCTQTHTPSTYMPLHSHTYAPFCDVWGQTFVAQLRVIEEEHARHDTIVSLNIWK